MLKPYIQMARVGFVLRRYFAVFCRHLSPKTCSSQIPRLLLIDFHASGIVFREKQRKVTGEHAPGMLKCAMLPTGSSHSLPYLYNSWSLRHKPVARAANSL